MKSGSSFPHRLRQRVLPAGSGREQMARRAWHLLIRLRNRYLHGNTNSQSAFQPFPSVQEYAAWIQQNEPGTDELKNQVTIISQLSFQPLISIIIPVYKPPMQVLIETIASLQAQTYIHWELCIANGSPDQPDLLMLLADLAAKDARIHSKILEKNFGISGNSNAALEMAHGEFTALLDQDDTLAPNALFEVVLSLNHNPQPDLVYSDHDLLTFNGQTRFRPLFKPDWSPEIMYSANYITHLTVIRTALMRTAGGFDPPTDGAQDYDLFFRVLERTQNIAHIAKILYHWRESATSTAMQVQHKPYAQLAQLRSIQAHLARSGMPDPQTFLDTTGFLRVSWKHPQPKVSIILPTRGASAYLKKCLSSLLSKTAYPNYEVLVINNGELRPEQIPYLGEITRDERVKIFHYEGKGSFNYSAINNFGARQADGELLLFLNNDTEVMQPDWLDEMVLWALHPECGAVGAKLLYGNRRIQHAGVIIGLTGFAGHIFANTPQGTLTTFGSPEWYRDFSAITAACLMTRRTLFEQVGGFNEALGLCGNDVDLCLRLRAESPKAGGLRIIYTPFARLLHLESATRGREIPLQDFIGSLQSYQTLLKSGDPYFNPNLSYWQAAPTLRITAEDHPYDFARQYIQFRQEKEGT